jgi:hypothetical protein
MVVGLDGSFKQCQEMMQAKSEINNVACDLPLFLQNLNPDL